MIVNVDESALTDPRKAGYDGLICKSTMVVFNLVFIESVRISNIHPTEIQAL